MRPLIAIPVYNEARTIDRVLDAVAPFAPDVLVINDGSTDQSAAILARRANVRVITHPENRGYGQSLIDAFRFASRRGFDWVLTMDCDEQHEPERIPDFLAAAARDQLDVISGSRYLVAFDGDDAPPADRQRINRTITGIVNSMLSFDLTDAFCGFKAHRVAAMSRLALDEPGYAFPLQFWVECARKELRIGEIPVRRIYRDRDRQFGGTLDDPASRLEHYLEVFLAALKRRDPAHADRAVSCCPLSPE